MRLEVGDEDVVETGEEAPHEEEDGGDAHGADVGGLRVAGVGGLLCRGYIQCFSLPLRSSYDGVKDSTGLERDYQHSVAGVTQDIATP